MRGDKFPLLFKHIIKKSENIVIPLAILDFSWYDSFKMYEERVCLIGHHSFNKDQLMEGCFYDE